MQIKMCMYESRVVVNFKEPIKHNAISYTEQGQVHFSILLYSDEERWHPERENEREEERERKIKRRGRC